MTRGMQIRFYWYFAISS